MYILIKIMHFPFFLRFCVTIISLILINITKICEVLRLRLDNIIVNILLFSIVYNSIKYRINNNNMDLDLLNPQSPVT